MRRCARDEGRPFGTLYGGRFQTTGCCVGPAQRWAPLARQVDPAPIRADDRGALAETIDRTHRAGGDVQTLLPQIAAQAPLSAQRPATDLRFRLAARLNVPNEPVPHRSARPGPGCRPPGCPARTPTPGRSPDSATPGR